ncbi:MAG: hypothetical protein H7338_06820 [Candidatus Sericytochromatia bacterium]|nr:hypothetical protein [Candidatus Sericytochromatia bacterium]
MTIPNDEIDTLLTGMIEQQQVRVLAIARERLPGVTPEDLRNPQDFPELEADSRFNFEDGQLSGLLSARMAIRQRRMRRA